MGQLLLSDSVFPAKLGVLLSSMATLEGYGLARSWNSSTSDRLMGGFIQALVLIVLPEQWLPPWPADGKGEEWCPQEKAALVCLPSRALGTTATQKASQSWSEDDQC